MSEIVIIENNELEEFHNVICDMQIIFNSIHAPEGTIDVTGFCELSKNKKVGLYIASTMSYLKKIYSYQTMATIPSLNKNLISLPIDENGDIDYEYMEKYISIIEKINIKDVVEWKDKIINKTKEVVRN